MRGLNGLEGKYKMKILIKPLSQNDAWKGKRYKTDHYKAFEMELLYRLPRIVIPSGELEINYRFGFSNKCMDIDNPTKSLQDVLSKKYGFNDNRVYRITIDKIIVPKGSEFVEFEIKELKAIL